MTLLVHGDAHDSHRGPRWVTAIDPTPEEVATLRARFGAEVVAHALDPNERSRVRSLGSTTFVVLRVPWFQGDAADVPYTTVPLGIVLGGPSGLTICARDCGVVRKLAERIEKDVSPHSAQHVVLHALELTAEAYLDHLEQLGRTVDALEARLQVSLENREVLQLLRYQKSLVYFTAALDAMHTMADRLEKVPALRLSTEDEAWLEDVRVELRQALETSMTSRDVMSEMMDAFASIISNNLNVVMKFLAAVTVILTFPVILASFYGMNVALPGQRSPHAFELSIVASVVVALGVALYFRRRNWL